MYYLAWLHPVLNGFNAITVAIALYYGGVLSHDTAIPVGLLVAFWGSPGTLRGTMPPIAALMMMRSKTRQRRQGLQHCFHVLMRTSSA